MTRILPWLFLALILFACSEEDGPVKPANPQQFSLEITVVDANGDPVANAAVELLPMLPEKYMLDYPGPLRQEPNRVRFSIMFLISEPCIVDVVIKDVAGRHVQTILESLHSEAGTRTVVWDGRDGRGNQQATGWYEAEVTCRDLETNDVLFTASAGLLMMLWSYEFTPYRTDANGVVDITDRRAIPGLWDIPDVHLVAANGVDSEFFTLTPRTFIRTPGAWAVLDVVDGRQKVTIQPQPAPTDLLAPLAEEPRTRLDVPAPFPEFELMPPRPNPFN